MHKDVKFQLKEHYNIHAKDMDSPVSKGMGYQKRINKNTNFMIFTSIIIQSHC